MTSQRHAYTSRSPFDDILATELNEVETIRSEAAANLKHMYAELDRLMDRNREAINRVLADHNDLAARNVMAKSDAEIESLKEEIAELRHKVGRELQILRLKIEKKIETNTRELEDELAEARMEHDMLASNLIPRAQAALDDCLERKRVLDSKILTLMSRINALNQHQVEAGLFEIR